MCAKYYDLRCMFKKMHLVKVGAFAWCSVKIRVCYGVWFERRKVEAVKLHKNSILENFEYFHHLSLYWIKGALFCFSFWLRVLD